ncbi:ferredoxin [Draconibacterium mangrovi]|uniref:ferredoxin n=1 Tax=Draconibacterium mangrovi TaxID=2697469 RepID=UPI0013D7ADF3|nr:ferredoxin [Draconibacterium mangrovi]
MIKRVWRDDNLNTCIACKMCNLFAPRVFKVFDKMIVVPGLDYTLYEQEIKEAAENCPVQIIIFEE